MPERPNGAVLKTASALRGAFVGSNPTPAVARGAASEHRGVAMVPHAIATRPCRNGAAHLRDTSPTRDYRLAVADPGHQAAASSTGVGTKRVKNGDHRFVTRDTGAE